MKNINFDGLSADEFREPERSARNGTLDFAEFPAAEYKFFDTVRTIGYRCRHEKYPMDFCKQDIERARKIYKKAGGLPIMSEAMNVIDRLRSFFKGSQTQEEGNCMPADITYLETAVSAAARRVHFHRFDGETHFVKYRAAFRDASAGGIKRDERTLITSRNSAK